MVAPAAGQRDAPRPRYRMYTVEVARTRQLTPSFVRVTFTCECLREFGAGGVDQRIKLMLPRPGRTVADIPDGAGWYAAWQAMPEDIRPTMRTYTVRSFRPEVGELDIDFVLHGANGDAGGPAAHWAATTEPGDRVALLGPDRPGSGRMWGCEWAPPPSASRLLLAGDETAVPAVAAIVESLPSEARGVICLEVPTAEDTLPWTPPEGVEVRWLARQRPDGHAPHGHTLEAAVTDALHELCPPAEAREAVNLDEVDLLWDVPAEPGYSGDGEIYGWLAGEAGVIKRLRRLLVNDYGLPRAAVAFMGYWRAGHA